MACVFCEAAETLSLPPTKRSKGKPVTNLNPESDATVTRRKCWRFRSGSGLRERYTVTYWGLFMSQAPPGHGTREPTALTTNYVRERGSINRW